MPEVVADNFDYIVFTFTGVIQGVQLAPLTLIVLINNL